MTAARWGEVKAVLAAVLDSDPGERERALDQLCHSDADLRREVESLLAMENRAGAVLESAAAPGVRFRSELTAAPPESVGPYRIVKEIGRGGMGAVYLAERDDGEYRKQVAIKLISMGRFDPGLQKRFRRERQILARFEHPGIARLIDGGATAQGQPYFVMEYVEGQPLIEFCESRRLPIAERIDLFLEVCGAVAHAHQRLIVHRDLKPSNILVRADGRPKLLDFGLARMLESGEGADENLTQAGFPVLTPAYASPEQMRGEPFTVSSDVYSLGVILFELLSGRRPYDVSGASVLEMARMVCEREPQPLSEAASDPALNRKLRGDLESIVAKALEKDPRRRYASVGDLTADLRRYLAGLPIQARHAGALYRALKFVNRHRLAVSATALAAALILGVAGVALYEAQRSERRFEEVRSLAHTVMFDLHDAIEPLPGSTKARALLVRSALDYLERLSRESAGDARLSWEVALGYRRIGTVQGYGPEANLGNTQAALESFRKSAAILDRLVARDPANRALRHDDIGVLSQLSTAYAASGDTDSAARAAQRAVALAEDGFRTHADDQATFDLAVARSGLADLSTNQGRYAEAIPIREQARDLFQKLSDAQPQNLERTRSAAVAHKRLAALYGVTGRFADASREYRQAQVLDEARSAANGSDLRAKMDLSFDYSDLGWVSSRLKDEPGALAWHQKALALRQEAARADPSNQRAADSIASSIGRISAVYFRMGDLDRALAYAEQALALWKARAERPGTGFNVLTEVADAHSDLGEIYSARHACARSAAEYEQARSIYSGLRERGVLPRSQYSKIDQLAADARACLNRSPK